MVVPEDSKVSTVMGQTELEVAKSDTGSQVNERDVFLMTIGAHEKARIMKNVLILGVAFMIHFTAFHGTANLQSSINTDASLGTYTLLSIYGSLMIANIFLPVIVIRYLGCKWTISLGFITYMPFIAAQFYPQVYTMIPSGLAVGFGGAALWCAKCTYLTVAAEAFSAITKNRIKANVLVVRFFGLFFFFYQTSQVWGNLISSSVLSNGNAVEDNSSSVDVGAICGVNFCPGITAEENPFLVRPDAAQINLLSGIFLGCMAGSVLLVAFGVDSLKRYDLGRVGAGGDLTGLKLLGVTAKHLKNKYQLLLIPITMFVGIDHAFINADLTSGFFACGWGISKIGYAMMCFGIANALGSGLAGLLTKLIGRFTVVAAIACIHLALIIFLLNWTPTPDGIIYCVIAAVWGLVNGIWLVQINALSGILFPGKEEVAFSNFRFFESLGSVGAYAVSPLLCMKVKMLLLIAIIVIGMAGYTTIEYLEKRRRKRQAPLASIAEADTGIERTSF